MGSSISVRGSRGFMKIGKAQPQAIVQNEVEKGPRRASTPLIQPRLDIFSEDNDADYDDDDDYGILEQESSLPAPSPVRMPITSTTDASPSVAFRETASATLLPQVASTTIPTTALTPVSPCFTSASLVPAGSANNSTATISATSTALDIATLETASPVTTDSNCQARISTGVIVGIAAASMSFFLILTGAIHLYSQRYPRRSVTLFLPKISRDSYKSGASGRSSYAGRLTAFDAHPHRSLRPNAALPSPIRIAGPLRLNPVTSTPTGNNQRYSWRASDTFARGQSRTAQSSYGRSPLPELPAPVHTGHGAANVRRSSGTSLGCSTAYDSTMSRSSTTTWRYGTRLAPGPRRREEVRGPEGQLSPCQLRSRAHDAHCSMPSTGTGWQAADPFQSQHEDRPGAASKEAPKAVAAVEELEEPCRSWLNGSSSAESDAMSALEVTEIVPCPPLKAPERSPCLAPSGGGRGLAFPWDGSDRKCPTARYGADNAP